MTDDNNIDALLSGTDNPSMPSVPESISPLIDDIPQDTPTPPVEKQEKATPDEPSEPKEGAKEGEGDEYGVSDDKKEPSAEVDDYGNPKKESKTYTEDEVNQRINEAVRARLERVERNTAPQQPQAGEAGAEEWQTQLTEYIESTVSGMTARQAQAQQQAVEQARTAEFEQKFVTGMSKFSNFKEVVGQHNITDAMIKASRGMNDPASFFFTACERSPDEIRRISQIPDPSVQMLELGRLEERTKTQAKRPHTKTPRPLEKVRSDSSSPHKEEKAFSLDEMLASSDTRRLAAIRGRRK